MKQKFTAIMLAIIATFSLFGLVGCKKDNKSLVYFLNFKPESASVYEELAKFYEDETGIKVKVVTASANNYEQTLKSEIAKSQPPTIFQVNGPVGYSNWSDYCYNLEKSQLYSFLSDKDLAIKDEKGVYAIPYVVEGYGIIYNDAIMQKYFNLKQKNTDIKSVDEINSFSKLKAVVEDMTVNKDALGIKGVFASTSLSTGEDWRWQTHLLNVPLYYEFAEKENVADVSLSLLEAKEIAYKYAKNFEQIFDLYINNSVTNKNLLGSKSVADSMAEFALGEAAMVQNGNWAWSQISGVKGNTVRENDIKMMPIYIGVNGEDKQGLCIGTENYFAINKNAGDEKIKASLDFLEWMFSSQKGKKYVTEKLGFITPFKTFSESEIPNDPLAKEINKYMKNDDINNIPWAFSAMPSDAFKKEVGNRLLAYVQGDAKWEEIRNKIIAKWKSERS